MNQYVTLLTGTKTNNKNALRLVDALFCFFYITINSENVTMATGGYIKLNNIKCIFVQYITKQRPRDYLFVHERFNIKIIAKKKTQMLHVVVVVVAVVCVFLFYDCVLLVLL